MDEMVNDDSRVKPHIERMVTALGAGAILLDSNNEIAWMDERTRARLNGGAKEFAAALSVLNTGPGGPCCLHVQEVKINGEALTVCLIQERERPHDEQGYNADTALEAVMADPSWFT